MLPDHPMYFVVVAHRGGPYVPETDLDRTSLVAVRQDIKSGQYENLLAVIEIDPVTHTCREATHDFQDLFAPD
jgi:hypothetical protein